MGATVTQIDEPNLEQEITNIFITIDNYGTAEEARVDIRKLIANQVREELTNLKIARLNLGTITTDHADGYQMAVDDMNRHIDDRIKELGE